MRDGNASTVVPSGSRGEGDAGRTENALQSLYEISKILASPGRLQAVLSSVLTELARFVDMQRGLIALIDDAGRATAAVGSAWGEGDAKAHFESLPKSLAARLVVTRKPFIVAVAIKDPPSAGWPVASGEGPIALIGAPIEMRDRVAGVVIVECITTDGDSAPREEDARFLAMK